MPRLPFRPSGRPAAVLVRLVALLALAGCSGGTCERLWYADRDGDGHGDRRSHERGCEAPPAHVEIPDDCDDREASIHPGASESCDGVDQDCDGEIDPDARVWYADADHDGYGTTLLTQSACAAPPGFTDLPGDCDDGEDGIHPGVSDELCDGRDQDCDDLVDEGAPGTTWWSPDADGDGQGDAFQSQRLCNPPDGWIDNDFDCDDSLWMVGTAFPESCDGLDNDCDSQIDEPSDVSDPQPWWADDDGDNFGDEARTTWSCSQPANFASQAGDCDDADAAVNPDADEVCNDRLDDDCDGFPDEDDASLDESSLVTGWTDLDLDGLGDPDDDVLACVLGPEVAGNDGDCDDEARFVGPDLWLEDADGDGVGAGTPVAGSGCAPPVPGMVNVAAGGDCDDLDPSVRPRIPDPCGDGFDQDCTGIDPACREAPVGLVALADLARAWATGTGAADGFGAAISAAADLDGDAMPDVAIGAPGAGEVRILLGPVPEVAGPAQGARTVLGAGIGGVVAVAPDVDGDGRAELLVGAPDEGTGVLYVLGDGGRSGTTATARTTFSGLLAGERVGSAVAALPDLTGDGNGEVAVGSTGIGAFGAGRVMVFELEDQGIVTAGTANLVVTGGGSFAHGIAPAFDADGDGTTDLAVGAPSNSDGGADSGSVYLLPADLLGNHVISAIGTAQLVGDAGSLLGSALAAGGDLDGDGLDDFAAAAPEDSTAGIGAGRVFVFADPTGLDDAATAAAFRVDGDGPGARVAQALAVGDLDGDGADDLLVGVEGADLTGTDAGAVYAFFGPMTGAAQAAEADALVYGAAGEQVGGALAFGDSDGDGADDLWVGMPLGAGAAKWVPGP